MSANLTANADIFAAQRPRLFGIAYRMLGSRADAEDVLQDAWLPEPLAQVDPATPEFHAEIASDLSVAFLNLLERLGQDERAAFVLHDAFDCGYDDIAEVLGKSESACRQLVHRARAALAWAEALTRLENQQVSDEVNNEVSAQFNEDELMRLTLAVVAINGWNRFQAGLKAKPGSHHAGSIKALRAS